MKVLLPILVLLALAVMGLLTSSTHLVFSLPSYAILSGAALIAAFAHPPREISKRTLLCLGATSIFLGYILIRTICSPVAYIARADLYIALGALILYLLVALHIRSARRRMLIVAFLLLLGVANVVVGAIQYTKGNNFMPFEFLNRSDYGIRSSGFFLCPNHFAGFLEVAAIMGLSLACWSRWKVWVRLVIGYFAVVCAGGVLMSGSRGGYASTIVGLVTFACLSIIVVRRQNKWLYWRLLAGNLLLAVVLVFGAERIIAKNWFVQSRATNIGNTEDVRVSLWKSAAEQFKLNPVVGTGSRTFQYYGRQFRPSGVINDPVYVHNDYLQLAAEYGVVGLAGFLLFLIAHLRSGGHAFKTLIAKRSTVSLLGSNTLALNVGALASVAAYMVHSFLDFNLHIPANALLMAFIFGLLTDSNSEVAPGKKAAQVTTPALASILRFSLPALGVWMALAALATFPGEFYAERARQALAELDYPAADENAGLGLMHTSTNPLLYYYKGEALVGLTESAVDPAVRTTLNDEAITYFQKAIGLYPQEENFILSLAWALDDLNRFDEARKAYARVMELDPRSAQVAFYYARHLHLSGDRTQAEQYYKKAQSMGSGSATYGLQRLIDEEKAIGTTRAVARDASK